MIDYYHEFKSSKYNKITKNIFRAKNMTTHKKFYSQNKKNMHPDVCPNKMTHRKYNTIRERFRNHHHH